MAFWLAVFLGALFSWIAVQVGFYAAWILFFNLLVATYMAVFLTPLAVASIPAATTMSYGYGLAMLSIGIMTLAIMYGLSFACLSGRLYMPMAKAFDNVGAGILGFFSGFLVWSFVAMAVSLTPLADLGFCQTIGFNATSQTTNRGYVCWWCNRFHDLVSVAHSTQTSQDAVAALLNKAVPIAPETSSQAPETTGDASAKPSPPPPAPPSMDAAVTTGTDTTTDSSTSASVGTVTVGSTAAAPTTKDETASATSNASAGTVTAGTTSAPLGSTPDMPKTAGTTSSPTASQKTAAMPTDQTPLNQEPSAKTQSEKTPPDETPEARFARRTSVLQSPDALATLLGNRDISALQVSPVCTLDKFTPETARRLQRWVADGGLLLVNNNVLGLFGLASEPLADRGPMVCVPAQSHAIVTDCQQVVLQPSGQKLRILPIGDVTPLLKLEKSGTTGDTVVWSLAPYGNGWVSDAKAVDPHQGEGAKFLQNFCTFCLNVKPKPSAGSANANAAPLSPSHGATAAGGPLTGVWQASAGAQFQIADDGKNFSIRLISSDALLMCSGVFAHPSSDKSPIKGTLYVILGSDVTTQHTVHVALTLENPNRLRLRCANWPALNPRTGRYVTRSYVETWNRVDEPLFRTGPSIVPERPSHGVEF